MEEYNKIVSNNWSFKDETIKYLNNDVNSLHEVLMKANKQIFNDFNVYMKDNITISALAMDIFLKQYYKNNIPRIDKHSVYTFFTGKGAYRLHNQFDPADFNIN